MSPRDPRRGIGPFIGWAILNTLIFMGVSLLLIFVYAVIAGIIEDGYYSDIFGEAAFAWVLAAITYVPGLVLYLVMLWLAGRRLRGRALRLLAVGMAPAIGAGTWFSPFSDPAFIAMFTTGVPLACGAVAMLPSSGVRETG